MAAIDSVVIVGGGLAGATAAFALRDLGHAGRVVVVADEDELPYERPPLSKSFLRGESSLTDALVRPETDYDARGVELLRGHRAAALDPSNRELVLADGATISYDALLLATGAEPRRLMTTGASLGGVHVLRDVSDAIALREAAAGASRIAVIGGGWIGSEVAASLRQVGHDVTFVTSLARPLERVLGPEVGDVYRDLHLEHGVELLRGHVAQLTGDDRVDGMELVDGRRVAVDLVVVGVGAVPRTRLAQEAGLEMAVGGVAVDERLRTSAPNVFAAGDVAAAFHPRHGRHVRVEHWDNAIRQARTAAANILGADEMYERTPYFYSDQFDLGMEYRGLAPTWDRVVIRGDLDARHFHAFWVADGRVVAAMNANLWDDGRALRRLVDGGARVDPRRLADPSVPLEAAA
jgi:3-phenylpropionate/trans-cinnamate dioxygenase ferredoxin reductase subunit